MHLIVGLSLALDVVSDRVFVSVLTYSTGEVSVRPEFAAPQLLLHVWAPSEYLARSKTLDHRDNLRHTIRRHRLNQKMHVLFIRADFQELDLISVFQLKAYVP